MVVSSWLYSDIELDCVMGFRLCAMARCRQGQLNRSAPSASLTKRARKREKPEETY
jgi:hypothetical protein